MSKNFKIVLCILYCKIRTSNFQISWNSQNFFGQKATYIAQNMKFSINDFFRECDHLLKKSLMENFIFCAGLALHW